MSSQPTTCSAYIPTEISVQLYLSKLQPAELSQLRDFRRNGSGNVAVLAKVPLGINARSVLRPFSIAKSQSLMASNLRSRLVAC
jgi:hypothetical protein